MSSVTEVVVAPYARTATPASDNGTGTVPIASGPDSSMTLRFALTFALYAIPLLVALRPIGTPICDPDLWWHLRVGQWVAEHQAVPWTDPFSAYGQGKTWLAYSWLYEVLLYGLYSALGLTGVVLYRATFAVAISAALHRYVVRNGMSDSFAAGLAAACLLAMAMLFSERPWLFTILFGILTLHAAMDLREGRRSVLPWFLPVFFVIWANVHIQFVYGLGLLVLACIAPVIDYRIGGGDAGSATQFRSAAWYKTVILTIACILATLVNPYQFRLYGVVIEYATQSGPFQFVNELKAPEFREPCEWAMLGLTMAGAFALGRQKRIRSFDVLLLAGCAILSFRSRRDLWLVSLASVSILSAPSLARVRAVEAGWPVRGRVALVAALVLFAVGLGVARDLAPGRLARTAATVFPADACRFIADNHLKGPIYNDFDWGGYLIWALPALPVAIDGRTNLHGDDRLLRFGATRAGTEGWRDDPDLSAAGIVLANVQTPLAALLMHDERFAFVYGDDLARVFVQRHETKP